MPQSIPQISLLYIFWLYSETSLVYFPIQELVKDLLCFWMLFYPLCFSLNMWWSRCINRIWTLQYIRHTLNLMLCQVNFNKSILYLSFIYLHVKWIDSIWPKWKYLNKFVNRDNPCNFVPFGKCKLVVVVNACPLFKRQCHYWWFVSWMFFKFNGINLFDQCCLDEY